MKQTFFALAAFAAAFFIQPAVAQKNQTIQGNGNSVTRTVSIQPFTKLDVGGVFELVLTQGATESVKIEADENLQELFTVNNEGSKLLISMKELKNKNLKSKNKMRVHVQFKNLTALNLHTVGNVKNTAPLRFDAFQFTNASVGNVDLNLRAENLEIENNSVGEMRLSGSAETAVLKNNGVGSLKAGDFVVQTLEVENSGIGSAEVNAAKGLKVQDSFLGKVHNKGAAPARKRGKVSI